MLPGRRRRTLELERVLARLIATGGVIGIGVAIAAIMVSSNPRAGSSGSGRGDRQRGAVGDPLVFAPALEPASLPPGGRLGPERRTMSYIVCEVWCMPGQQVGPPGALIPISRCGALEIPTSPHPTSAIGSPVVTSCADGDQAGAAWP